MTPRLVVASLLIFTPIASCRAEVVTPVFAPQTEPKASAVSTSTREIRDLKFAGKDLWAATAGGVLRYTSKWQKWTRQNGLPSNEAFAIETSKSGVTIRFPLNKSTFNGKTWSSIPAPSFQKNATTVLWKGQKVRATIDGLTIGKRNFPNPPSGGTHISALIIRPKSLLAAFYGDGLWNFDGQKWTPDARNAKLTASAKEITALTANGQTLYIGTRRAGVWTSNAKDWRPLGDIWKPEIVNHNIQFLTEFGGVLWASTLDDGLMLRNSNGWAQVTTPTLSSTAPRQLLQWQDQLYVRHGGGLVDSFDGRNWTKDALKTIPRKGVYALTADEKTLFAAGWGGWSEWDGRNWTPHFEVPELKGVPLMGLMVDGDTLWIATQSRGLGRYNRTDATFRWFDERDGLPDDWITALTKFEGKIYAGTFVGGLARLDDDKWTVFHELSKENVTALTFSGDRLFAATRHGVWEIEGNAATKIDAPWLDTEVQALYPGKTGLWIGARTSLNFLKN